MRARRYIVPFAVAGLLSAGVAASSFGEAATVPVRVDARAATAEKAAWEASGQAQYFIVLHDAEAAQAWQAMADHEAEVFYEAAAEAEARAAIPRLRPPDPGPQALRTPQRPSQGPSRAAPSVGGACGGATNGADAFIGRESGGNPNARNSSGAWGCYQIMPGTWASSCSDLGQHGSASTQAQAQCASRLPSSSWAASGG